MVRIGPVFEVQVFYNIIIELFISGLEENKVVASCCTKYIYIHVSCGSELKRSIGLQSGRKSRRKRERDK